MLEAAQDGVIRIPLQKQETGFLSQLYAESETEPTNWADYLPGTQLPQVFDMSDPEQKQQAIWLGQLANV